MATATFDLNCEHFCPLAIAICGRLAAIGALAVKDETSEAVHALTHSATEDPFHLHDVRKET